MDYKTESGKCAVVSSNDKGEAKQITFHSLEELESELSNLQKARDEIVKEYLDPIDNEIELCQKRIDIVKSEEIPAKLDEIIGGTK